ncbi:MAG: peptidoglycan D,D-transpeptidase FtsI family protein [Brevinemataceae bacterium]
MESNIMTKLPRFHIFILGIFLIFGLTILRLGQTTLFPDKRLKTSFEKTNNPRGKIYDKFGHLIAGVSSTRSLYARPKKLSDELRDYLKSALFSTGYFSEEELKNFDKTNRHFVYIKRDMTPSITKPVEELYNILKKEKYLTQDELGLISEESRFYPYFFLSPIIGSIGREGSGLQGIEYTFNSELQQGLDIHLTLDIEVSRIAYEELARSVSESDADSGSVVILDIKSRELLALVQAGKNSESPLSVSYIYEPGSVMKMFTAAFAMEQGLASTTSPLFDDNTAYKIGDYTFNKPVLGYIPLGIMLKKSANISFARLAGQFGSNDFYLWMKELGFGSKPDLPLTSLEKGILHPPNKWSALSKPMIAIGQEIGVTTIQLASAAAVIGGGGKFIPLSLIRSIKTPSGQELSTNNRQSKQLFHPQKSKELLYAMEQSILKGGTGSKAALDGIRSAGKTGTGMIAKSGYTEGRNNTTFIGFLPLENPSLVIVIAIHNPKGSSRSGGGVSAPLFANIVRRIALSTSYLE